MFERFTPQARHVVVFAQEEARALRHQHIGTEHVLLGLLGEPDGIAGQVLQTFGLTLTAAREQVAERVPASKNAAAGHIPFTPRSKKLLEYALREAVGLGHNYIGTEHVLLGLLRDSDGVGAQIAGQAGDLGAVRQAVLDSLPAQAAGAGPRWLRSPDPGALAGRGEQLRTTPAADSSLNIAIRIAGGRAVGSHHLLLAALSDPGNAAARALTGLGVDLGQALRALREVDVTGTNDEPPEEAGRRQMIIRATGNQLVLETSDTVLLDLARAAMGALGPAATAAGVIPGDLAASASLGAVWQALRTSLEDVRRRASAQQPAPAAPAAPAEPGGPPAPAEPGGPGRAESAPPEHGTSTGPAVS